MLCKICNRECKNPISLSKHIRIHNISSEEYYRQFFAYNDKCKICNKPTRFVSISIGYKDTCSNKCSAIYTKDKRIQTCLQKYGVDNPTKSKEVRQKISNTVKSEECQNKIKATCRLKYGVDYANQAECIKSKKITKTNSKLCHQHRNDWAAQYEQDNNCTRISTLIKQYGQGWLSLKLDKIQVKGYSFIKNSDIYLIEQYKNNISKPEKELYEFIKSFHNIVTFHNKQIIKPLELDIYLPDLKLAIEYNGTFWHSISSGTKIDYHLNKSIACREKGIRLIHVYEFEDFEKQKQLIKDLILGIDKYPKNDFNKNNLITNIPNPELIYTSERGYMIYGAGKLY